MPMQHAAAAELRRAGYQLSGQLARHVHAEQKPDVLYSTRPCSCNQFPWSNVGTDDAISGIQADISVAYASSVYWLACLSCPWSSRKSQGRSWTLQTRCGWLAAGKRLCPGTDTHPGCLELCSAHVLLTDAYMKQHTSCLCLLTEACTLTLVRQ